MIDLQRIHIKILTDAPPTLDLYPFIEIFGRWRADKNHPAGWVDLADYAHVPRGSGVVLAGLRANVAFDMSDDNGRSAPGILYAARKGLSGTYAERIASALRSCLELAQRLAAEPEFPAGVHLRSDALELRFPDRLLTPNTEATHAALCPAVTEIFDRLYGPLAEGRYQLLPVSDPAEAFGCSLRAGESAPLAALLQRLR